MNKKIIALASLVGSLAMPAMAFAYTFTPDPPPANVPINILAVLGGLFNFIWPIAVAVIIIMFMLAGFQFLVAQGDAAKISQARQSLIWGTAGVAIILLAFSIITIVRFTIGGGAI
jgi:hypothetical protein